jgi:mevalonate kinase
MPAITAIAHGKVILFGEHAVVYGRPAIAAPVAQVQARAVISAEPRAEPASIRIQAPAVGVDQDFASLPPETPLAAVIRNVMAALKISTPPACKIRITSTIPIAAGLGSGAAVSVAVIRAFSAFLGAPLPDDRVSALAFEIEKYHHGTPSGIDNTVITYDKPVFFVRGQALELLRVNAPFQIVIGDTGISSPTAITVGDVRRQWEADTKRFERLFDATAQIVHTARLIIETGDPAELGPLIDENHRLLQEMGVSSFELDHLVMAARNAGALGAKLCGGGRGGNMIAFVGAGIGGVESGKRVVQALRKAGAVRTILTQVGR